QVRYGSADSVRVTFVVDRHESGEADLYVDANRNRIIEAKDRLEGRGLAWRLPLDAAVVGEETVVNSYPRHVAVKLGSTGRTLLFATAGYVEGTVEVGGRRLAARRVDGNGNGLFADPDDRLWIDLNGDGEWNAFTEQWLFAPVLRVGNERLSARSNPLGHQLTLAPLTDTGQLKLKLPESIEPETVLDVSATLVGSDGSIVSLSGLDRAVDVPAGKYRMNVLSLSLDGGSGQPPWNFLFATDRNRDAPWHEVGKDRTLILDPVGRLEFTLTGGEGVEAAKPGEELSLQPQLYTGENLLIVTCYRGSDDSEDHQPKCRVAVCSADGKELASHTCGFV
ncbi:MAG TPA: hypothetical protein VML55_16375, partial [Planctomycetaceae bacterium]|nr:hypothetical protein [Planctomycetaceae bacterium]